jgi:hypothetical protein
MLPRKPENLTSSAIASGNEERDLFCNLLLFWLLVIRARAHGARAYGAHGARAYGARAYGARYGMTLISLTL